jgi:chemotaxis protein methyltransferase CheR
MTPSEFEFISQLLKRRSGLVLTPEKAYLIESRVAPLVRKHNLPGFEAVVMKMRANDEKIIRDVVEAMTTNE